MPSLDLARNSHYWEKETSSQQNEVYGALLPDLSKGFDYY